ncbi:MAG: FAD-binding oxidoreductase [Pseudomonadota bacterium]
MSLAESHDNSLIDQLVAELGQEHVLTDEASCVLYAQDVYTKSIPAKAVIRPGSTEQLSRAVAAVTGAGHAVIPRGGGMSYTRGYVPVEAGSVVVDMQRMNNIVEINADDMYVTVECGCTWKDLNDALEGSGLRTPYWGTLSGIHATVGGGLSQNSIFWGSARFGTAADSVIGLEVVLADGSVVKTGAGAQTNGTPFFRHYGPDLTGLFSCDAGALGFKAVATFRLVPVREHRDAVSFDFEDYPSIIGAMSEIARAEIADEVFGFDPYLQSVRMQRESVMSDVKKLAGVLKSGKSLMGSIKDGAKVAMAGRGFMDQVKFSMHVMIEEKTEAAVQAGIAEARLICERHGGREIENSIPKIIRANPFTPLNNMVGPNGERWVPIHTLLPHSKARHVTERTYAVFEQYREELDKHGIGTGFLFAAVSTNGFVLEPVFFTPDSLNEIHRQYVEDHVLKKLPGFERNDEAAEVTARVRQALIDLYEEEGGIHMQIGKSYPYKQGLNADSIELVERIKAAVDPARRVNPGALGLD